MSTMTFRLNNGELSMVNRARNILEDMNKSMPLSTAYIVDMPRIKESIKNMEFAKGKTMSVAPVGLVLGVATANGGIFWDIFMEYIFPWLTDVAKVFCAIKIAQAFYQERRGGREEGTGFGAFVTYGKWLLLFHLLPFGVELIDQIGEKMWTDLKTTKLQ